MDREPRPALLFLGDSRTRWLLLWQAQQICDPMLRCFRYLGAPRCSFSVRDVPLVLALDGMANWRSGGGFVCSDASALSFVGYYVHYGLSSQPPYQRNAGTWHAQNDFDNESYDSTSQMLRAFDRFRNATRMQPLVVVLSSLVWDIGRAQILHHNLKSLQIGANERQGWTEWLDEYERNWTSVAKNVRGRLRMAPDERQGEGDSRSIHVHNGTWDRLLLQADFSCGGHLSAVCKYVAPRAAGRVRRVAAALDVGLLDVNALYSSIDSPDKATGLLMREYKYTLHPSFSGACVAWHGLAHLDPRLPDCTPSCVDIIQNTSNEGVTVNKQLRSRKGGRHVSMLLAPLPRRSARTATLPNGGCLAEAGTLSVMHGEPADAEQEEGLGMRTAILRQAGPMAS